MSALHSYPLLIRWQILRLRQFLPILIIVQGLLAFGIVAGYTLVHLLAFGLVGLVLAWSAERLQRSPDMWLIWLLAFIVAEGVFLATAGTSGEWVMGAIGWWAVGMGNLVGIAAMAWRVRKTHPLLEDRLREAVNVRI